MTTATHRLAIRALLEGPLTPDAIDAFVEARRAEEGPDADRGDWVREGEIPGASRA